MYKKIHTCICYVGSNVLFIVYSILLVQGHFTIYLIDGFSKEVEHGSKKR